MANMAAFDAIMLAERLRGLGREEYWMHFEAASSLEKYPAKHHARRVRDKLDVSQGLIYLPGAPARNNEDSDMPAPFRQRRYFYYLSGCNEADCYVTYDIQHDKVALFIPRIDEKRVIWNGRGSTPTEALDKYDIDEVYFTDELASFLSNWVMNYLGSLYILRDSQAPEIVVAPSLLDSTSLQPAMNLTRMIKDEHEIKLIRKANDISSEAHKQVLANVLKFKNEAQVEGLFLDVCISNQAKEQAYDPIAASGPNAGTLHYDANNEDFEDRQLMCLDAGCEYELYASDITRTFPLSGSWPSTESSNIYKLVQRMQEACIQKLAPGVRYLDLHILAHHIAIDGLLRLGILHNGTREEIYKAGTSRAFFPHGLGHHVGLEVHDVGQRELMSVYQRNPRYQKAPSLYPENFHIPVYDEEACRAPTNPESPHLEEGMVVTVEPGIYFSSYALSRFYLPSPVHSKYINSEILSKYLPVGGVRIEDDILITAKGHENLTTAPKGEAMLEIIRSQNAKWPLVQGAADRECIQTPLAQPKEVAEERLLRAPGIPKRVGDPRIKPVSRAATAPIERSRDRNSVDFEPFEGPSLFSSFKRSMTIDESLNYANTTHQAHRARPLPVCGDASPNFTHFYMGWQFESGNDFGSTGNFNKAPKPICNRCTILSQAVDRLRQTLNQSEKSSPNPSPPTAKVEPAAMRKSPEMQQVGVASHRRVPGTRDSYPTSWGQEQYVNHSSEKQNAAWPASQRGSQYELRNKANANASGVKTLADMPQRRSVTFDSYLQHAQPMTTKAQTTSSSNLLAQLTGPPFWQEQKCVDPTLLQQSTAVSSNQNLQFLSDQRLQQHSATKPQPAAARGLPTGFEREREARFHPFARGPTTRPSLPTLRSERPAALSNRHSVHYQGPHLTTNPILNHTSPSNSHIRPETLRHSAPRHPSVPRRQHSLRSLPQNSPHPNTTTVTQPLQPNQSQALHDFASTLQDRKLEDLRRAMDDLCRVKEDVEKAFGEAWGRERDL